MSLELLLFAILIGGAVAYIATKLHQGLGAWVTVVVSVGALAALFLNRDSLTGSGAGTLLGWQFTTYGWFFSIVLLLTYAASSFFNPYWMNKLAHPAAYNLLFLFSLAGAIGMFFASTFIALFVCWELVVWTSMFIIPLGKSRRASVIYYAISTIGSFSMLYGILLLYSRFHSFDIQFVLHQLAGDPKLAALAFFLIVIAGVTKLGIFPFHVWLPIAHGNAPHTFSPVLSGGIVKMGAFVAFLMTAVMPSFNAFASQVQVFGIPLENYLLLVLGAISIVIGTLMAIKQDDAKRLIAYSTVANSGYILIGMGLANQIGLAGGLMHVFNHAMASAAMFLTMAAVAYRTGTTKMSNLGGLIHRMPVTFTVYLIAIISLAGIPPMSGFVSKWLIFQALSQQGMVFVAFAVFFGSIGSFLYVFRPLSAVFLGQLSTKHADVKEAPIAMQIPMYFLSALTLFFGTMPGVLLKYIGKIESAVGIQPIIVDGTKVVGANGVLNPVVMTTVFGFGFVLALLLFLALPKTKKVGLMDTYTSSEFIYTPELYHYAHNFYAPFERLYAKHPSVEKLYDKMALRASEIGQVADSWFSSVNPSRTALWISLVVTIFFLWGGK